MRKRIGLFLGEFLNYSRDLTLALYNIAKDHDTDVFVFYNFGIYDNILFQYSEGEKSIMRLPDYSTFDGIIVEESMFNIDGMGSELYDYLQKNATCPIVYIKSIKDSYPSILFSDKQSMKEITNHLIKDFGLTDICHMAGRWSNDDTYTRLEGYKEAMEEAGLKVTDDMIYSGEYYIYKAKETLDYFLEYHGHYPEAIVCANDYMAISLIDELTDRGIRVPEDIRISGYDNIVQAKNQDIPLTSFDVDPTAVAKKAFELLTDINAGKEVPKCNYVNNKMVLRYSTDPDIPKEVSDHTTEYRELNAAFAGLETIFFMNTAYDSSFTEEEIFSVADAYFPNSRSLRSFVCLTEDAFDSMDRPAELMGFFTDKMVLKRVFYGDSSKHYDTPEITFDRRLILPEKYYLEEPSIYFVNTIHAGMKVYGYLVSVFKSGDYPNRFIQSYVGNMGKALENFNIRTQFTDVDEMKRAYLLDSLTGLYNRRGFENNIHIFEEKAERNNLFLSVASIDMDGLKYINDTFGHNEGDAALTEFANVLLATMESGEICARYGGDEFAALLLSSDPKRHERFITTLEQNLSILNSSMTKPYTLHASAGIVLMKDYPGQNLMGCMKKADEIMYANKAAYKKLHGGEVR